MVRTPHTGQRGGYNRSAAHVSARIGETLGQPQIGRNVASCARLAIVAHMRCGLCGERAEWWRRRCPTCRALWNAWLEHGGAGMRRLLDALVATGATPEHIERFLDAEPRLGQGTIRDLMAATMANQLLDALGQAPTQSGTDAKRLRERGTWRDYGRRPPS